MGRRSDARGRGVGVAVAAALVVGGLSLTVPGIVQAAPTFTWVEGSAAEGRLLYGVTEDGRLAVTDSASSFGGTGVRVIETATGAVVSLPPVVGPQPYLSGDGSRVVFATGTRLAVEDVDQLDDVYSMSIGDPSDVELLSPGYDTFAMTPFATNSSGLMAVMRASSQTLLETRVVAGGASGIRDVVISPPAEFTVHAMSRSGNLVLFSMPETCGTGICWPLREFWFPTGAVTPRYDVGGAPVEAIAAAMTSDGVCTGYITPVSRAVWRQCGSQAPQVVDPFPAMVSSGGFRCPRIAISADGSTISWLGLETLRIPNGTFSVAGVLQRSVSGPVDHLTRDGVGEASAAVDCLHAASDGLYFSSASDSLTAGGGLGVRRIHRYGEPLPPPPTTTAPTTTAPNTTAPNTTAPAVGSAGPVPGAGVFTGRTPVRILDTRIGLGAPAGLPSGGSSVVIPVRGRNGVPPDATAVAVQLTATEGTTVGYVSLLPTGSVVGRSSNLNLDVAGETIANSAIVPIGSDGSITVYTHGSTHLIVDLAGWWTPATQAAAAGRFRPVGPVRMLDTRADSTIGHTGGKPAAGSTTVVQVTGRLGVPATGVAAVVLNVTIAEPESLGFVQVSPAASLQPGASSTLNVGRAGQVIAVSTIVPVDVAGRIAVYSQPSTHLVVDVAGWFTDASASPGLDGMFVPAPDVDPRRLDTRPFSATWTGAKPVAGQRIDIPASGGAMVGNITVVDTEGPGFVQLGPARSMVNGATSNINPTTRGEVVANAFIVPVDAGGLGIYTSNGTHLLVDVVGTMTA